MKKILLGVAVIGLLVGSMGCAQNGMVGSNGVKAGVYYGGVGITGHNNNLTIQRGSRVWKLSIIGNGNTATVEDEVTLNAIEFWGHDNIVNVPDNLVFRVTELGGNQIVRRPAGKHGDLDYMPGEILPPELPRPVRRAAPPPPQPAPEPAPMPPPKEEPPLK